MLLDTYGEVQAENFKVMQRGWLGAILDFKNQKTIDRLYEQNTTPFPSSKLYFDFLYLLTVSPLEKHIKIFLLEQYFEIKKHIESIKNLPMGSFLIIMPPDSIVDLHQHPNITKHTISFIYTVDYNEATSFITVDNSKYYIPIAGNKFLLNMLNNPIHGCENKTGWLFIWLTDYSEEIDIPLDIREKYHLLRPSMKD